MRIAYLILHYMAGEDTIECVHSILDVSKQSEHKILVIVVDNGSTNNSFFRICKEFGNNTNVKLIHSDINLGFAKGNNLGFHYAKYEWNADFIVQLNNDTIVSQKNFNEMIVKKYDEKKYGVLGPDILTADGFHQNPGRTVNWNRKRLLLFRSKKKIQYLLSYFKIFDSLLSINKGSYQEECIRNDVYNTALHGSCLIFSRIFIEKFDGMYEGTFLYMEEDILKLQADHYGFLMMYSPDLRLYHKEDAATNMVASDSLTKKRRVYKYLIDSSKAYLDLMNEYDREK